MMESLINSRIGLILAASVAQATPSWFGYRLAGLIADWIALHRDSSLVRNVRANQWVALGEPETPKILDQAVREVMHNIAYTIYEVYHYLQDHREAGNLFVLEPSFQDLIITRSEFERRGLVIAGLHMNGFDLALQWICRTWIKPLVLTIPDPKGGRLVEFEIRKKMGINLVPASVAGFRQAIRHLKQGGMVVTGIDRAAPECEIRPRFLGRAACLPVHHIYLALKTHTPVVIAVNRREKDGKYHLLATPPIEMEECSDHNQALLHNAEKILAIAEDFIRQTPQQWIMSQPVWPEALELAPA